MLLTPGGLPAVRPGRRPLMIPLPEEPLCRSRSVTITRQVLGRVPA